MAKKADADLQPVDLSDLPEDDQPETIDKKDKKDKKDKRDKKKDRKKEAKQNKDKKGFPIVPLAVLLALALGIAGVLVLNVLNIREGYVMPYLRNAPLLGRLIPAGPETETDGTAVSAADAQAVQELMEQIQLLEYEIEKLEADLKTAETQRAADEETIRILRTYEATMEEHRLRVAQFDEMIANGDPNAYAAFYASVAPENADRIYRQVIADRQFTADEKKLVNIYMQMGSDTAAAALEQLLPSDASLVARIIQSMDAAYAAPIMDEMTAANRAVVTRLIAPTPVPARTEQDLTPLATPTTVPVADAAGTP